MGLEFEGEVAVVTGGANGIGAAIARELAARGASVAVVDIAQAAGGERMKAWRCARHQVRRRQRDLRGDREGIRRADDPH